MTFELFLQIVVPAVAAVGGYFLRSWVGLPQRPQPGQLQPGQPSDPAAILSALVNQFLARLLPPATPLNPAPPAGPNLPAQPDGPNLIDMLAARVRGLLADFLKDQK